MQQPNIFWTRIKTLAALALLLTPLGYAGPAMADDSKEVVFFTYPDTVRYIAGQRQAFVDELKTLGYSTKTIVNQFSAAQQSQQVQQFVASGEKPAAIVLWPVDPNAGVTEAAQLSAVAPVFQINYAVAEGGFKYVKAWVGPDDDLIGQTAGENIVKLRDQLVKDGRKLHSAGGNLLVIGARPGSYTAVHRFEAMSKAIAGSGVNLIHNEYCCSDTQGAYQMALQMFPQYKSDIDFVYTQNNETAAGIVRAAKEQGLVAGKDFYIVSGNCGGPRAIAVEGAVAASGEQLAGVEGAGMALTIAAYLKTGKVLEGRQEIKYSHDIPALGDEPPHQMNPLPNPTLQKDDADKTVWGLTVAQQCPLY